MKHEWLTERCESLTAQDVRLREMPELDLSEDNKRKLLERSEQLKRWETTKWLPFIADLMPDDEVWRFTARRKHGPIFVAVLATSFFVMDRSFARLQPCATDSFVFYENGARTT
jgi:hypothetical protein